VRFVYECWKCDNWHETTAKDAGQLLRYGYARPALELAGKRLTISRRLFWLWENHPRKIAAPTMRRKK
jgi:hypothetical protein